MFFFNCVLYMSDEEEQSNKDSQSLRDMIERVKIAFIEISCELPAIKEQLNTTIEILKETKTEHDVDIAITIFKDLLSVYFIGLLEQPSNIEEKINNITRRFVMLLKDLDDIAKE